MAPGFPSPTTCLVPFSLLQPDPPLNNVRHILFLSCESLQWLPVAFKDNSLFPKVQKALYNPACTGLLSALPHRLSAVIVAGSLPSLPQGLCTRCFRCLLSFYHSVVFNYLQPHGLQASLSLLTFMSTESVILSSHLILLLPSVFASIRVFANELTVRNTWPEYWGFRISPSNEYSGLISFRIDWFDLQAIQGTLKTLLQHHNLKASILQCSAFLMVQLSHPYMTTGKNYSFDYIDLCWQSDVSAF